MKSVSQLIDQNIEEFNPHSIVRNEQSRKQAWKGQH